MLLAYLRAELNDSTIEYTVPPAQLSGGFQTATYQFQITGVQNRLSNRLVLRLYPEYVQPDDAVMESTVQNTLAEAGFPVAKAHLSCADISVLGGAFFIMDYLAGEPMIKAPLETIPALLGKTHAALHQVDANPIVRLLAKQGIDGDRYRLRNHLHTLRETAENQEWIREGVDWLLENQPPEPERLAVCHGDFQPLNILIRDGEVSGVLDWPGFLIADPAYDVGNTIMLTKAFEHIAPSVSPAFSSFRSEMIVKPYLDAYRSERHLEETYLDYYRVRRCVHALIQGKQGQAIWQHPLIVRDIVDFISATTGIHITT